VTITDEGTGLGLSFAREIIRAHGGELEQGPAADGWTWFHVTLPLG
jgi:signal transduction histidine kinase